MSVMTDLECVREFHLAMGQPVAYKPSPITPDRARLRMALVLEEAGLELAKALGSDGTIVRIMELALRMLRFDAFDGVQDVAEVADACGDGRYVLCGTEVECGIPGDKVFAEIHRSNMSKKGGAFRADGKLEKPSTYSPPDIEHAFHLAKNRSLGEQGVEMVHSTWRPVAGERVLVDGQRVATVKVPYEWVAWVKYDDGLGPETTVALYRMRPAVAVETLNAALTSVETAVPVGNVFGDPEPPEPPAMQSSGLDEACPAVGTYGPCLHLAGHRERCSFPPPPASSARCAAIAIGDRVEVTVDGFLRLGTVAALDAVAVDIGGPIVAVEPSKVRAVPR